MHSIHADINAHVVSLAEGQKLHLESGGQHLATLQWQIAPGVVVSSRNERTLGMAGGPSDAEPPSKSILNMIFMPAHLRDDDRCPLSCLIILQLCAASQDVAAALF